MKRVSEVKARGYLSSTLSVFLLAIPALKSALESSVMLACLLAGMALSIIGMGLRWHSHRLEQSEKGSRYRIVKPGPDEGIMAD